MAVARGHVQQPAAIGLLVAQHAFQDALRLGRRFADEPVSRRYLRGTLAMANAGPNTNGSQFFVMHADYALPPNYTIFGKLTAGEEVVDAIATAPTGAQDRPITPITINKVTIAEA